MIITRMFNISKVKDNDEIIWKALGGEMRMATAVHCDCGLLCSVNTCTVKNDRIAHNLLANADEIQIEELEGEFDDNGNFICPHN